jgi:hypothetical protein
MMESTKVMSRMCRRLDGLFLAFVGLHLHGEALFLNLGI